jgi:hypothetical protein
VPEDRFLDFKLVVQQSAALDPFGEDIGGFAGAPFAQLVGYLFSVIQPASLRLPIFFGSFFVVFIPMVKHYLYGLKARPSLHRWIPLFALVFLTYPVLFALDRANFDILVCASLLLFAFMCQRQKHTASTVFLALAIALKPYTIVLAMVYVFDKRYRHFVIVLCGAFFLSALSLSLFKDGLLVEAQKYLSSLSQTTTHLSGGNLQQYTSDLYGLLTAVIKSIGDALGIDSSATTMYLPAHPAATMAYTLVAVVVLIYFIIYLWKEPHPLWRALAVLTILLILLPFNSGDYRLIYLFAPMLIYMAVREKTRYGLLIVVLWGLLLVPKNYYPLHLAPTDYYSYTLHQTIGMVINPLLLIGLLFCIVPDAFSTRGMASTFRFACGRLQSIGHIRKLENPRSS